MKSIHRVSWAVVACLTLAIAPSAFASDEEIRDRQEKQRQVQAETDHVVRRITTMIRVMQFYNLESPEKKIMEEMSGTLSGLSKNQMSEVIRELEKAALAKDEKQSEEAHDKAYDSHRVVLRSLHEMLARFDAIKSLDQAADRFEKQGKHQLDLHLQSTQSIHDLIESSKPDLSPTMRLLINRRSKSLGTEMKRQSDNQNDLERDVTILVNQVRDLAPKLNPEQQDRIKAMDKLMAEYRLYEHLTVAARRLRALGYPENRIREFRVANELQWTNASNLQELARVLRMPGDLLSVLKEAREKVEQAIAKQEEIKEEVKQQEEKTKDVAKEKDQKDQKDQKKDQKNQKEKLTLPGLEPLPKVASPAEKKAAIEKAIQNAVNAEKNADLAKKQAKLAFDTKDIENALKPIAKDTAKNLETAEQAMKEAKESLLKNEPKKAATPQAKATEKLKDVKADLDKMIAAAEKAKTDPLAAVKNAIENLDDIIKEQAKTKDDTKETVGQPENLKLPELASKQKELAAKTQDVKNAPLPNNEKVDAALDKATKEMKKAAKNLDAKKSPEAVAKQEKALDALKEARQELAEKAAEIEKRRDDIAKLEEAAKKLGDLAKEEKNVAQKADASAKQPKADTAANKDIAKEQGDLTPKANDLAKELDKTAPKAAEKVADSTKDMKAAKKNLDKNAAKPAAQEAKAATKKLNDAEKELQNALNDLKGKEIADQAALQKNTDPASTAQQLAKALEEAQKAADASKDAQKATEMAKNDQPQKNQPQADLAKLQADVAKKADGMKLKDAAKDAQKAAEALKNADFPKALEDQAKALKQLQEAAAKEPMPGEKGKGEPKAKGEPTAKLAQEQKALMEATKALAQSKEATQAAQAALAQAQAQAPQGVQPQLKEAAKDLQKAAQQLQNAKPGEAGQAQQQAADKLDMALQTLNKALAQIDKDGQATAKKEPGQGKEPGKGEGKEPGQGEGKEPGQGNEPGEQPGQGQAKGKQPGKSQEKNTAKGEGERKADGTVSNKNSKLNDVNGDGAFMHLPPRQRDLIRQAISGSLPPEYANLIQQYYINIARGRAASGAAPAAPAPQR